MESFRPASVAELSNTSRYSVFKTGDLTIKFKTSPYLERYCSVSKWNNGYIECKAKYSTLPEPVEDYIDLRYIADRLHLPDNIFCDIKEVTVR
ncbi:MAG: hypothetical protein J6M64_08070 [Oscillospiraceae bacterium]|nr:hypothetical protein [Oscillospiraceae bacterium]